MTREEAIQYNKNLKEYMRITDKKSEYKFLEENYIALEMAIKALEQEPTKEEQALLQKWRDNRGISIEDFEDAMNALQEPKTEQEDDYFRKIVEVAISQLRADRDRLEDELAKREQEPKTGHWIETGDYFTGAYGDLGYYECSCCHEDSLEEGDYCPNCGAKMVEPQERSDKE